MFLASIDANVLFDFQSGTKKDDPAPLSDFAVPENIFEIPREIGSWGEGRV